MVRTIAVGLALCGLLCGCAAERTADGAQQALDFRQKMLGGACSFQAKITADYEDYVCEFSLFCTHSPDGGTDMTILTPETLEGLRAHAGGDGMKVVFEDTEAAFGSLAGRSLSPMAAVQMAASAWESGYISLTGTEEGLVHVTYLLGYDDDELTVDTWLDKGAPVRAELAADGRTFLYLRLTDFTFTDAVRKAETEDEITQTDVGGYFAGQSGV